MWCYKDVHYLAKFDLSVWKVADDVIYNLLEMQYYMYFKRQILCIIKVSIIESI